MKKISLFILLLLFTVSASHSQIRSKVDERFELTSIVARLAGYEEYSNCPFASYAEDIDTYFSPYADDELIGHMRMLRERYAIGYDAIPSVAAMLEIKNGKIALKPEYDVAVIVSEDSRWNEKEVSKYIKLLNQFYKRADFHKFFTTHASIYDTAERSLNEMTEKIDLDWFASFYGKQFDPDIQVFVSIANGPNHYAFDEGVLMGASSDGNGNPFFNSYNFYVLLHEINHHYTYPLFESNWERMKSAADAIYPFVSQKMRRAAYGNARTSFYEWLTDLCVLMYYKEKDNQYRELTIWTCTLMEKGFIWMERSVNFMDNFYENRNDYPHIKDYMEQLALFLNYTADNFDFVVKEFENRSPYITNVFPVVGSDISDTRHIRFTFSEPMRTDCKGIWPVNNPDILFLPTDFDGSYWENDRTFVVSVITDELEKNQSYGIRLAPIAYRSVKDYQTDESYYMEFIYNTGEAEAHECE